MSEGTPGRGPDADSRTDAGDGQAPTNGRSAVPPVRYGPRNGGPNGRPAPSSPQQYRAPQPPRTSPNGTPPNGTPTTGANGSGTNGAGTNGNGSNGNTTNGNGTNGAHAATPASYTRPRTGAAPVRPEPTEQERRVADARIAAAARNASAAKARGGSGSNGSAPTAPEAKTATPKDASAPVDETAVIPVVPAADAGSTPTAPTGDADTTETAPAATGDAGTERARGGRFGRLRSRRPGVAPVVAAGAAAATAAAPTAEAAATTAAPADAVTTRTAPVDKTADPVETAQGATVEKTDKADKAVEPDAAAEPTGTTTEAPTSETATTETAKTETAKTDRPLTWRDRLGLAPKQPTPSPDAPTTEAATTDVSPTGDVAGAATVGAAAATAASAPVQDRVSPSPFARDGSTDTVVIPAVDAATTGAPVPVAGATALPVVPAAAPRPKVGAARRTRKARLRLSRVDPWSVMKTALLFSIAAGIILVVATYGVWSVLNASGLFTAVNDMVKSVVSTPGDTTPFRIEDYVNTQKIIGVAALIAVVDVLIFTALATLGSFLYNLAATVLGGLEVTLAED